MSNLLAPVRRTLFNISALASYRLAGEKAAKPN